MASAARARGRGLLVTATDTGVGKTVVTAALALALGARGLDVGLAKPIQSGALVTDPDGDAATLMRLTGFATEARAVCRYAYEAPLAPALAAGPDGPSAEALLDAVRGTLTQHQLTLVEGAGGLLVPLAGTFTVADLAVELELPLVVVARPGLGTVNHTWLTVECARRRGLTVAGVVLNGYRADSGDPSEAANPRLIEDLARTSVIGRTPWLDGALTRGRLEQELVPALDVAALLAGFAPTTPAR